MNINKQLLVRLTKKMIKVISFVFVIYIFGRVFLFSLFNITSESMAPLLSRGDKIFVCKLIYGARLINISDYIRNDTISFWRLLGLGNVKRNDVIVFNYPYKYWNQWDKIELQHNKYYVKRCIAIPGDSLRIVNGIYCITGIEDDLGDVYSQKKLQEYRKFNNAIDSVIPYSKSWTVYDMGPFYIPHKGEKILLDSLNYALYKNIIEWESTQLLTFEEGSVKLGNKPIYYYTFKYNYYFVGGDNVLESVDSRYWGLLPDIFIVGKFYFKF